jgi:hypothetical protein
LKEISVNWNFFETLKRKEEENGEGFQFFFFNLILALWGVFGVKSETGGFRAL